MLILIVIAPHRVGVWAVLSENGYFIGKQL